MKIGNTPGVGPLTGATSANRDSGATSTPKVASTTADKKVDSATVKLSSTASALLDAADNGFNAEKVDRVRKSISDGTYKINADAIADKLIANAQEVLGKVGGAAR